MKRGGREPVSVIRLGVLLRDPQRQTGCSAVALLQSSLGHINLGLPRSLAGLPGTKRRQGWGRAGGGWDGSAWLPMAAAECGEWLTTATTAAPETKSCACQHFPFLACERSHAD